MKTSILKYLGVFATYFIVDASYQILFGLPFGQKIQAATGIQDIFATSPQNPELMLIWFAIMTLAIVKLVVEPAVASKSIKTAALKGILLGVTAYATLGLPNGWSLKDYPMGLVLEIVLEGFLFAPTAAVVTTWWLLKQQKLKP
jgi:uncharacterized membrane protein